MKRIFSQVNLPTTFISSSKSASYTVKCVVPSSLSYDEHEEIFQIALFNMRKYYEDSGWGWRPAEKRNEFFHPLSRIYIIYDDGAKKIAGYGIFRFEFDDEDEPEFLVLYCYELQVRTEYQRQGLGYQVMIDAH